MTIIDTNYIVRYLSRDIEDEYILTKKLIADVMAEIWIPTIVFAEVVFILENHYKIPKETIIQGLEVMTRQSNISCEGFVYDSFQVYKNSNVSYYDALIIAEAKYRNCEIKSLDKKMMRTFKSEK